MIKLKKATMALVAILFTATTYAQTPNECTIRFTEARIR